MGDLSEHFSRAEFACGCGCGLDTVDAKLLELLESVRAHFARPVAITSGCRCEAYNAQVGGSPHSQHRLGRAADIQVEGVIPAKVHRFLAENIGQRFGLGCYDSFTHIDSRTRGPARWYV